MDATTKHKGWEANAAQIWGLEIDESTTLDCTISQAYRAVEYQRIRNPDCRRRFRFKSVGDAVRVTRREDQPEYNLDDWGVGETRSFIGQNTDRWRLMRRLNADFHASKRNAMLFETAVYGRNYFSITRVK